MSKQLFTILLICCTAMGLNAQVSCVPVFPCVDDNVTITFDANAGNAGLAGFTGPIYAHTGVITNASTSNSDWRHVNVQWATANPAYLMTSIGNGLYTLSFNIRSFYGIAATGETVLKMSFVFRSVDGMITGKAAGNADIFYDMGCAGSTLQTLIVRPSSACTSANAGTTINFSGAASLASNLTLTDNGTQIASATNARNLDFTITAASGSHNLVFTAVNGAQTVTKTAGYFVPSAVVVADPPAGNQLGANINAAGNSITFLFQAPNKNSVFLIGNFNNWCPDNSYALKKSTDGKTWWVTVAATPGQDFLYQYYVDGTLRVADPLSTLVLDQSSDATIPASTFPNIPAYPSNNTSGFISWLKPGAPAYPWAVPNFSRPLNTDLVVYELLPRDFVAKHDYQTLIDSINYFKSLKINAIELMPIAEFDNNDSWGYNPSYHAALDKYYGTPEKFKQFVDLCHQNGIAVILDVVFNHVTGNSPLAQMYWNAATNNPAANNPWLNVQATHPYSVFNDFNHESQLTKDYMDRCLKNWLVEYKVDGFRFDLSKGMTQTVSNDATAGNYDQSRINILNRMYDVIQLVSPNAYVILEHFCATSEETVLANKGMMLWANMVNNSNQCTMGYNSSTDLGWSSAAAHGYAKPGAMAYIESHDEERIMYKNIQFGNISGTYSVHDLATACKRNEALGAFFFTVPGPKMYWQFFELGYDEAINSNGGRTSKKPLHWEYLSVPARRHLYDVTRDLSFLHKTYPAFRSTNYNYADLNTGLVKHFHVTDATMNVTVIGNFDVTAQNMTPYFQHTGKWYDYLSGDSVNVTSTTLQRNLLAGEYHVYTDVKLPAPPSGYLNLVSETNEINNYVNLFEIYPNPAVSGKTTIGYSLRQSAEVAYEVFNMLGQRLFQSEKNLQTQGSYTEELTTPLLAGTYIVRLTVNGATVSQKLVVGSKN
jgi:1,4-alpha-glucan branching enzyme